MAKKTPFVDMSGVSKTLKKIEKFAETSPVVFDRTLKDMSSRAPGQVASAVTSVYGIKKGEIKYKKGHSKMAAGNISVQGDKLATFELIYSGRVLTPLHFGMTPKVRPDKKYKVKAKILKSGKKKGFIKPAELKQGKGVFLAPAGGTGSKEIPWFRHSKDRFNITPIKTLSLPQMVGPTEDGKWKGNPEVQKLIGEKLGDLLEKRYNNHLKQHMNKNLK